MRRRQLDLAAPGARSYGAPMTELTTFLLFAATTIALVAIPGPNALYIAARSVAHGRHEGGASARARERGWLVQGRADPSGVEAL